QRFPSKSPTSFSTRAASRYKGSMVRPLLGKTMHADESDHDDPLEALYDRWEREYGESDAFAARAPRRPRTAPAASLILEAEQPQPSLPMTYKPSRFESTWLASSLRPFYEENLITDVLYHVKGGKEASVYCCKAADDLGSPL